MSRDMSPLYLMFWKYRNSLQNYIRDKFIFMSIIVYSTKHIFVFTVFIPSVS